MLDRSSLMEEEKKQTLKKRLTRGLAQEYRCINLKLNQSKFTVGLHLGVGDMF